MTQAQMTKDDRPQGADRAADVPGQAELDAGLAAIPAALAACGYADFMASLFPHAIRPATWPPLAQLADAELRRVIGLFLLGEEVAAADLPGPVADLLPLLAASGVASLSAAGGARLSGLVLIYTRGVWLFVHRPQVSPTLYLGDDSFALADRLALVPGSCLDLCAGPGLQSLVSARRGAAVTAVEINPVAAALCRVNAGVNGLAGQVAVHCADLYDGAGGQRFDNILANPPLLPIPAGVPYPFVGDGGPDGLTVTRRILAGLPAHLAAGGQAQLIGMGLSDGILPAMLDELSAFAASTGIDITLTVAAHLSASADSGWARGVAATAAAHAGAPRPDVLAAVVSGYADLGATHVCTYALSARRGHGALRYLDLSDAPGTGLWFA